ncbi:MaoC family dehydratase N-terminal domain-containing protein (plasmid) [Paraburkholderia sp. D15]|uniref:FAS1-like dehydratase domain-containing protein n=1 Tax=Paraburkholderia sp. D15 TaxID=2880218 RepID=UPI00247A1F3C|nr:MaoC family dehydratase N-terminal domain-containing protein [Paraburkholderia sp. D15]WGS54869.1 MaoC family dehydratase N-terminal domain-containing protein [Paraburkholderia sp. D15]
MSDSNVPLADWVSTQEVTREVVTAFPLSALAATLDRTEARDCVPPLWHWLYFLPVAPQAEVDSDGHPKRGGFLPPVRLPRRMWAGGRLTFHTALQVGEQMTRTSTILRVEDKIGRSGRLVFVTVRHAIEAEGKLKIEEEQDIVYRDAPGTDAVAPPPERAPVDEVWRRVVDTGPVMLFRYSALTFNGHRIHYDRPYATGVEGYPDLVVHGPLVATLLIDLVARESPEATIRRFTFKAVRPAFANRPLTLCGRLSNDGNTVELWAMDHEGYLTMRASAELA